MRVVYSAAHERARHDVKTVIGLVDGVFRIGFFVENVMDGCFRIDNAKMQAKVWRAEVSVDDERFLIEFVGERCTECRNSGGFADAAFDADDAYYFTHGIPL